MSEQVRGFFRRWLITTLGVLVADFLLPGIWYDSAGALFLASLTLGLLNAFVRPILVFFSLPFVLLTLGLGLLLINALLLLFVGKVIRGFHVDGFGSAFLGALVISVSTFLLNLMIGRSAVQGVTRPPPQSRGDAGPTIDV